MAKTKSYTEAELIDIFHLQRITTHELPTLTDWLTISPPQLSETEQFLFDHIYTSAVKHIVGWNEEDLKLKFIAFVLLLGQLQDTDAFLTFFEKTISATVQGHLLTAKTDFMVAKGILDMPKMPYFHFQEYKPHKKPTGDSMAQLLEAMLIAQTLNQNEHAIYGCEVVGKYWNFVVLEGNSYCVSASYECTQRNELLAIIGILRKFRHILETKLIL